MTDQMAYRVGPAAEVAGVSRQVIERAIHAGHLKAKRTAPAKGSGRGGYFLVRRRDLEAWIDGLVDA